MRSTMTMKVLKQRMEGQRRKVNSRPEIHVTVQELVLQDDGSIAFSTNEFSMEGLRVRAFVEIKGTRTSIIKELGQEAAKRSLQRAASLVGKGASKLPKLPKLSLGRGSQREVDSSPQELEDPESEQARMLGRAAEGEAGAGAEAAPELLQTCSVELTLSMAQEPGSEKVKVQIREVEVGENTFTSKEMARKVFKNSKIRAMIEAGVSRVAQHVVSKKLRSTKAKLRAALFDKFCRCFSRCLRQSDDGGL